MKKYYFWNKKKKKKIEPIFWFSPNIQIREPYTNYIIAPTISIDEIGSGIPFGVIFSTVILKPFIFPAIA